MIHPPLVISQRGVLAGQDPGFLARAARLAGILHVIVIDPQTP
jgi:hypothetical protein